MMNYKNIYETIVAQTISYLKSNNIKSMILGISGGLDSTVVAAIGMEVNRLTQIPLIGISMPSSTNNIDENDSACKALKAFCNVQKINCIDKIVQPFQLSLDDVNENKSTNLSKGNLKARIRMIYLYDLASIHRGIVMDTDNLTEHYLGFWTIHGDVGDFNPIGGLWKSEVYELAKWIRDNVYEPGSDAYNALNDAINILPTDGNGVALGGDMGQIAAGYTYTEVDKLLQFYLEGSHSEEDYLKFVDDVFNGDKVTADKVIERHLNSCFKRKHMPIRIHRDNFDIK